MQQQAGHRRRALNKRELVTKSLLIFLWHSLPRMHSSLACPKDFSHLSIARVLVCTVFRHSEPVP